MDAQATPRSFQKESFNPGIYSRRYACDRCRGHKLRCNRDATAPGNGPCHRCIKAKAQCTITSSSRPGRSFELDIGGGVEYATSKGPLHPSNGNGDVDNCPSSRNDNRIHVFQVKPLCLFANISLSHPPGPTGSAKYAVWINAWSR
jgi:hypothetical protein